MASTARGCHARDADVANVNVTKYRDSGKPCRAPAPMSAGHRGCRAVSMASNDAVSQDLPASPPMVEFALGLLIGLGAGVAVALLTAPAPGRDARAWVLARSAAARRRTAEYLQAHNAMEIMRQRGVRGLLKFIREHEREAQGPQHVTPSPTPVATGSAAAVRSTAAL
jgi:hypothetical protein